ncbi:hypothetical protein VB713_07240 [Anabaena cylindrica UHCC 0172]|uniref:hypothetical protein n=1 Tax=Anabaena cylindrica TaxID=1165 RepID=UPI002B1F5299|nr:hypothetical protein [Anabaena cylindrica]MEA5550771.1 hypothetical protein [Anabaena cylindrica UHCC 0172]
MQASEKAAKLAKFKDAEIIATLSGEPLYTKFGYQVIERFEISLQNSQFLPVVRMFKSFRRNPASDFS